MDRNNATRKVSDTWASGDLYEPYVGRWSRLVAAEFLRWLSLPAGGRWLEIGCGTGALSATLLRDASPKALTAIDPSPEFVSFASRKIKDERATFNVGSAGSLGFPDGHFDAVLSGLVLNFVPQADRAVVEMRRVATSKGIVAAYVWDYAEKMELMRYFWDAAIALDPAALELDEGRRFPLCQPEPLKQLFESGGLRDVEVRAIDVETRFRHFDDYWNPFLGGQGPAPGYAMSLTKVRRDELGENIRAKLPITADGTIRLTARAWAVRGIK